MLRALVLFAVLLLLFTPPAFGGVPELNVNRQFGQFSSWLKRATNSAFELSIGLKSLSVGEGKDLHHDHPRDPHRRVDPVICIE